MSSPSRGNSTIVSTF